MVHLFYFMNLTKVYIFLCHSLRITNSIPYRFYSTYRTYHKYLIMRDIIGSDNLQSSVLSFFAICLSEQVSMQAHISRIVFLYLVQVRHMYLDMETKWKFVYSFYERPSYFKTFFHVQCGTIDPIRSLRCYLFFSTTFPFSCFLRKICNGEPCYVTCSIDTCCFML